MCVHYEVVSPPAHGEHIIGKCLRCGREIDYSVLQEQDPGFRKMVLRDTNPVTTLERIMAVKKAKKSRGRLNNYSRGRV